MHGCSPRPHPPFHRFTDVDFVLPMSISLVCSLTYLFPSTSSLLTSSSSSSSPSSSSYSSPLLISAACRWPRLKQSLHPACFVWACDIMWSSRSHSSSMIPFRKELMSVTNFLSSSSCFWATCTSVLGSGSCPRPRRTPAVRLCPRSLHPVAALVNIASSRVADLQTYSPTQGWCFPNGAASVAKAAEAREDSGLEG